MFDTYVTVIGNVLTAPEWRRTTQSGTLVANFKVASTARRLDRDTGRWVDGNSLRVRVNCWRKLAEGVASSVMVGDPVVVVGRMYTRDWTDEAGNHRTMYEVDAVAVGHDLARGRGRFVRNRPTMSTSTVEDAETEARVRGETTEPVPDADAPALLADHAFDDGDGDYVNPPLAPTRGLDPIAPVSDGFTDRADGDEPAAGLGDSPEITLLIDPLPGDSTTAEPLDEQASDAERRKDQPADVGDQHELDDQHGLGGEPSGDAQPTTPPETGGRARRGRSRSIQPA